MQRYGSVAAHIAATDGAMVIDRREANAKSGWVAHIGATEATPLSRRHVSAQMGPRWLPSALTGMPWRPRHMLPPTPPQS